MCTDLRYHHIMPMSHVTRSPIMYQVVTVVSWRAGLLPKAGAWVWLQQDLGQTAAIVGRDEQDLDRRKMIGGGGAKAHDRVLAGKRVAWKVRSRCTAPLEDQWRLFLPGR